MQLDATVGLGRTLSHFHQFVAYDLIEMLLEQVIPDNALTPHLGPALVLSFGTA